MAEDCSQTVISVVLFEVILFFTTITAAMITITRSTDGITIPWLKDPVFIGGPEGTAVGLLFL